MLRLLKNLPSKFERDLGVDDKYVIRMKKRFNWDIHKPIEEQRKKALNKYVKKTRGYLFYIFENEDKIMVHKERKFRVMTNLANMPSTVLIFAVFHWISELVRYNQKLFSKYMNQNRTGCYMNSLIMH